MLLLCLVPFSSSSKPGDNVDWHLVIFNKWFNLKRKFNIKYFTYITCDCEYFCFKCNWLKPNKQNQQHYAKYVRLPMSKQCYQVGYLVDNDWVWFNQQNVNWDEHNELYKESDTYKTKFMLIEDDGTKTKVNVEVKAQGRRFAPIMLKSTLLKNLYCKLNKTEVTEVDVCISTDMNSYKGKGEQINTHLYHPFIFNLMLSWVDFKNYRLGEILNGRKFI